MIRARLMAAWPTLRALLIAGHVLAIVALAFPAPHKLTNPRAWASQNHQAELARWSERLTGLGYPIDKPTLERELRAVAESYARTHRAILAPFGYYARAAGTHQGWAMFANPQKHPAELHVDIRTDARSDHAPASAAPARPAAHIGVVRAGRDQADDEPAGSDQAGADQAGADQAGWRPIIRPHSAEHDFWGHALRHNRMRKQLGRFGRTFYPQSYDGLTRYIAHAAARAFPEAVEIRARLYRYPSPSPAQVRAGDAPPGRYEHERRFDAAALRAEAWP
ncbi:MAG: hypothetical protein Tsb0020_45960 [Haliangiales bacterium]